MAACLLLGCGRSELYAGEAEQPALDATASSEDSAIGDEAGAPVDAQSQAVDGPAEVGALDAAFARDAATRDASDGAPDGCPVGGCVLVFDSGPGWSSWSGTISTSPPSFMLGQSLGAAADVCLNSGDPTNCPSDAVLYGYASSPQVLWSGGKTIPAATWIWRADVMASQSASNQVAIFQRSVVVGGGASGSLVIAVDDMALVFVNGTLAGSVGSVTDMSFAGPAHTVATTINLTPVLRTGVNLITIAAENGPFGGSPYTYAQNPAGVVFEGTLRW